MTREQALALLGLPGNATPNDISAAIAREYRLWQSRTNAPDFEAQTHARRRIKDLGEAEFVLLGDRRTRAHQPSPAPPTGAHVPAGSRAPTGAPAPPGASQPPPPPYGQQPSSPAWGPQPGPPQPGYAPNWSWPPPAVPAKPPVQVGDPIEVGTRFVAKFIDVFALSMVSAFGAGLLSATGFRSASSMFGEILAAVVLATWALTYVTVFESQWGMTLGKMAMKIEVKDQFGKKPSVERALKRNAWIGLLFVPYLGGLALAVAAVTVAVSISNSPTKHGWHDDFAGRTQVTKAA